MANKEQGKGSSEFIQIGDFFDGLKSNLRANRLAVKDTDLFKKPLKDGIIRPGELLIEACGLQTTRSHNELIKSPNKRHRHSLSLSPTVKHDVIRISDSHTTETDIEAVGPKAKSFTAVDQQEHIFYLTSDGWLIDDAKAREGANWRTLMSKMPRKKVSDRADAWRYNHGTPGAFESDYLDVLQAEQKSRSPIWRKIARKISLDKPETKKVVSTKETPVMMEYRDLQTFFRQLVGKKDVKGYVEPPLGDGPSRAGVELQKIYTTQIDQRRFGTTQRSLAARSQRQAVATLLAPRGGICEDVIKIYDTANTRPVGTTFFLTSDKWLIGTEHISANELIPQDLIDAYLEDNVTYEREFMEELLKLKNNRSVTWSKNARKVELK